MSESEPIECTVHFRRKSRSQKVIAEGAAVVLAVTGKLPRVTRLLALAHRFDGYLRDGVVESHTELARLGHVTVARICQIMNLLNLAPDIQEAILFLTPMQERAPILLQQMQPIASTLDWSVQRELWKKLGHKVRSSEISPS